MIVPVAGVLEMLLAVVGELVVVNIGDGDLFGFLLSILCAKL